MKRLASLFMLLVLAVSLFACSASAKPVESTTSAPEATATLEATEAPTPAATEAPKVITFTDANLEDAVRTALNKPDGDITVAETEAITVLNLQNADWDAMNAENGGIKDISDLKYFPNLKELHLDFNDVQDLSPLSNLECVSKSIYLGLMQEVCGCRLNARTPNTYTHAYHNG